MPLHEAKTLLQKNPTEHITPQGDPVMFNLCGALVRFRQGAPGRVCGQADALLLPF